MLSASLNKTFPSFLARKPSFSKSVPKGLHRLPSRTRYTSSGVRCCGTSGTHVQNPDVATLCCSCYAGICPRVVKCVHACVCARGSVCTKSDTFHATYVGGGVLKIQTLNIFYYTRPIHVSKYHSESACLL